MRIIMEGVEYMIKFLLTRAGFTDIVENKDGTVDATREGIRYRKMYMSDWKLKDNDYVVRQGTVCIRET